MVGSPCCALLPKRKYCGVFPPLIIHHSLLFNRSLIQAARFSQKTNFLNKFMINAWFKDSKDF